MLISFPVAFWTGALFTDAAGGVTHDPFWFRMSVALVAMGTSTGALAAIFGYIDYRTVAMSPKARSIATGHLWWSLGAIAIFALAFALRAHVAASRAGIAVTIGGALLLLVGGYLGSELTNKFRVGILDVSRPSGRRKTPSESA